MTRFFARIIVCLLVLGSSPTTGAQNIQEQRKGVVKITSRVGGQTIVGTGIIVHLDEDAAYIVTASHVIEGDPQPQVRFFPKPTRPFTATVLGLDSGNPKGLAALVVEGKLPSGLHPLTLEASTTLIGGERVRIIGFPRVAGVAWAVSEGSITGQKGPDLVFSGAADEGNSGGPLLLHGTVVGVITEKAGDFGWATPAQAVRFALEGWQVPLPEAGPTTPGLAAQPPPEPPTPPQPSLRITAKDGAPMVLVPAGKFTMGSNTLEDAKEHPVYVDAFFIDQFEVTTRRYSKFLNETGYDEPKYWNQVKLDRHSRHPVVGINWYDAKTYCQWADKRLPREAEWEKAARGTDGRKFPWGNGEPHYRQANFGEEWNFFPYENGLQPIGSNDFGKSPYEAFDMAGNVKEWVEDWFDENYYSNSSPQNPKGPATGEFRILRGGSWADDLDNLLSANRDSDFPQHKLSENGVRCVKDAL